MTGLQLSKEEKKEIRDKNITDLFRHHELLFKALGITNPRFDSKAFNNVAKVPSVPGDSVGFFKSQLDENKDLYFEINTFYQQIIDPKRQLYVLRANPHYNSEPEKYQYVDVTPAGSQYYVNLKDLERVNMPTHPLVSENINDKIYKDSIEQIMDSADEDNAVEEMTARDWACLYLKVAKSKREWLNTLIKQSINN